MHTKRVGFLVAVYLVFGANARAETFQVRHDHILGSCTGELAFSDTTVEYSTGKKEHARVWKYEDIQQLEIAPGRISVLTYHVRKRELGADQAYNFTVLSGELTDRFRQSVQSRLTRPLVSSIVPEPVQARYTLPVRHRRFMGGSQGILELAGDYIVYRAAEPMDSRIWRYDELLSVGSTGPFQLRLGVLKSKGGGYGDEKNYVFDLKRRLTAEEYDFIWNKINRPQIDGTGRPGNASRNAQP